VRFARTRKFKFTRNVLKTPGEVERRWPGYLFRGRVRTSTVALILVFLAVWWINDSYRPSSQEPLQVPATEVVPPGFVPDPNYTWAPRSRLRQSPSTVTVTITPTTTPPTPTETTTTSPTPSTTSPTPAPPPPFVLPPPFGPPPPPPPPGPSPAPSPPP
jgi:hypothetical protein